jgi:hypothetical protein
MPEPVKIYPGENLAEDLTAEQYGVLMDWFRSNGIDPGGVPADKPVTIDSVIDFWWLAVRGLTTPDARSLEAFAESGELPLIHLQMDVSVPLPDDLAAALRKLAARWEPDPTLAALAAFREVTGWTDAQVEHYARCPLCTPICGHEEYDCPDSLRLKRAGRPAPSGGVS